MGNFGRTQLRTSSFPNLRYKVFSDICVASSSATSAFSDLFVTVPPQQALSEASRSLLPRNKRIPRPLCHCPFATSAFPDLYVAPPPQQALSQTSVALLLDHSLLERYLAGSYCSARTSPCHNPYVVAITKSASRLVPDELVAYQADGTSAGL